MPIKIKFVKSLLIVLKLNSSALNAKAKGTNKAREVKLFPNPTSSSLIIKLENSILKKVNIYNSLGQLVKSETSSLINIENLKSGIYNINIITNKGKRCKKFIVN